MKNPDRQGDSITELQRQNAELKQVKDDLHKAQRALRIVRSSGNVMLDAKNEHHLLHEICRILVQEGGYRLAWFGFVEYDDKKSVRPVAQEGYEKGYLDTVDITWADTEKGRGPEGTAIRQGRPSIVKDILVDPKYGPWRQEATQRGYASSITLPLFMADKVFGQRTHGLEERGAQHRRDSHPYSEPDT